MIKKDTRENKGSLYLESPLNRTKRRANVGPKGVEKCWKWKRENERMSQTRVAFELSYMLACFLSFFFSFLLFIYSFQRFHSFFVLFSTIFKFSSVLFRSLLSPLHHTYTHVTSLSTCTDEIQLPIPRKFLIRCLPRTSLRTS